MAFADDGRGLAVWEQYDAGVRRILARYYDGSSWSGAAFRISTTIGTKPRVATNGTRWVITWLEPAGSLQHAMRASWTLAGGATTPVRENTTLNGFDTAIASVDGTFVMTWLEDRNLYAKHSADGLTFGARESLGGNAEVNGTAIQLVALPGLYASAFVDLFGNTFVSERPSSAAGTWSSTVQRTGVCSIARMETTWGGLCTARSGSGPVTGFVGLSAATTTFATSFTGRALSVGGQGDRLRAVWGQSARDYEPILEWAPPLTLPAAMTALADDSIRFFALGPGTGGNGLDVFVENASGFVLQQALDATGSVMGTPSLTRGRGELGALWTRPGTIAEVWGTVF